MIIYFKNSKILTFFTFTLVFLTISDWLAINLFPLPNGIRHLLILAFLTITILAQQKSSQSSVDKELFKSILLIIIYITITSFKATAPLLNFLMGNFFTFFFVLVLLLSTTIKITELDFLKALHTLTIFFLLMGIIPLIESIINLSSMRYFPGMFRELGGLGAAMNLGIASTLYLYIRTKRKRYIWYAFIFTAIVLMTILKKSIISSIIIWSVFLIFYRKDFKIKTKNIFLVVGLLTIPLIFVLNELASNINQNIEYLNNAGAEGHVRLVMYIVGFKIFSDFFPIGSGGGSFGTPASVYNNYSSIYYEYGISEIEPLSPQRIALNEGHTMFDTFWPHIIAELGFIGTILFLLVWTYPVRSCYKWYKKNSNEDNKSALFLILSTTLFITNDGFTLFTPEIPLFVFYAFGINGILMSNTGRLNK